MKKNIDIRVQALISDVYLGKIADYIGMNRNDFYRRLRFRELPPKEKTRLLNIIEELQK